MPRPCPIDSAQRASLIKEYQSGVSRNVLAVKYGASRPFVTDCLRQAGVRVRGIVEACPGFPLNHDAFACASESETASYFVGLLMADGCISAPPNRTPHVIIQLARQDEGILRSFLDFLDALVAIQQVPPKDNGTVKSGPMSRVDIASRQMVDDLARYGVVPRKTAQAKASEDMAVNSHFWRGAIDGDGSVGIAFRSARYKPRPVVQLVGSLPLMEQFADFARDTVQATARPHQSKSIWGVSLTCSVAVRMLRLLYPDASVALPRKRERAVAILAEYE